MKPGERGYTLIELLISITIMILVSGVTGAAVFQVFKGIDYNNDYSAAVRQVDNAGFWISRDAQMASSMTTENLTSPDFLVIDWAEWDAEGDPTYHSARYFFEGLTDGVGKLKRAHTSTAGANQTTLVATYIYYSPGADNTSTASYQGSLLTLNLTSRLEKAMETKEYKINQRINVGAQ